MTSGPPNIVFNPYEWLPSFGENSIAIHSRELERTVDIVYNDPTDLHLCKRPLRFEGVCAFYRASLTGIKMLGIDLQRDPDSLGAIMEYSRSQAADAWTKHFGGVREMERGRSWRWNGDGRWNGDAASIDSSCVPVSPAASDRYALAEVNYDLAVKASLPSWARERRPGPR